MALQLRSDGEPRLLTKDGNKGKNTEKGRNVSETTAESAGKKPKEAAKLAGEISENPEAEEQIVQLKNLGEMYKNGELKDMQRKRYEDLVNSIRTELDRDVPTVIEMNKEIDINYYNAHPEEAATEADNTVNSPENIENVDLVVRVINHSNYLGENNQQKLKTVISSEINKLDEDSKLIRKNLSAKK